MEVVYSRQEHGGYPIYRSADKIEVIWPSGIGKRTYPNTRKTLLAVVNNDPDLQKPTPKDLCYSWDRYFRKGKYSKKTPYTQGVLELFGDRSLSIVSTKTREQDLSLSVAEPKLGIDLSVKALDVRKLFYAGFSYKVIAMGYDPEDVLQELYRGLIVRNNGKCPFDERKSSFGHYVHMVAGCIISNYRRKFSRIEKNEVVGVKDENGERQDVACSKLAKDAAAEDTEYEVQTLKDFLKSKVLERCRKENMDVVRADVVVDMMFLGCKNKDIIESTGYSSNWVSKFLKFARGVMKEVWP